MATLTLPSAPVDLDRIAAGEAGAITLDGVSHTVRAISAASLQLLRAATTATYIEAALTVVRRHVPTLSEDEALLLSVAQLEAVLAVATHDVDLIARLDPNYEAPDPNASGPAMGQHAQTSPA